MKSRTVLIAPENHYAEFDNGHIYTNVTRSSIKRIKRICSVLAGMGGWYMLNSDWRKAGWPIVDRMVAVA